MKRSSFLIVLILVSYFITFVGCTRTDTAFKSTGSGDNTSNSFTNLSQSSSATKNSQLGSDSENNDTGISDATGPKTVDNLKSITVENLNDEKNLKVTLDLPEGWYAKELIYDKASDFEFNAEKNKTIKKVISYEFYDSVKMDKYNELGFGGRAGLFEMPSYYRDQPEITRFPNHSEVKSRVYSGKTLLGQGEIFVLNCDLPKEMRTDKYSTYDMIYVWIPIKGEALAFNLSISVPLGENNDGYLEMVKKMLNADNQAYLNSNDNDGITNMSYNKLISELKSQGYKIDEIKQPDNETKHTFFLVYPKYIELNGNRISVYEFPDVSTADSQAKTISKDGFTIGNAMIEWIDKPHFYKQGKLIVGYVGRDNQILNSLNKILGEPITK